MRKIVSFSFCKENDLTFGRTSLTLKADRAGDQGFALATTNMTSSYFKKKKKSPIAGQFFTYQLRVSTFMVVKKSKKFCHIPSLCNIIKLYLKKQPEVALSYHLM